MFNDYDITNLKVKLKFAVQEDVYVVRSEKKWTLSSK